MKKNEKDWSSLHGSWRYQGNISCKVGHNKGQKQQGPNNRSRIGGKNAQKNYTKKDLNDLDNHDGVITHLEPDILEYEVKWALGSITMNKASGGDGIPVELFQILKCCESAALNMPAHLENSAMATGLEKVSFHSNTKEKQC